MRDALPEPDFQGFAAAVRQVVPAGRFLLDEFSRTVHGADASPYSLLPRAVILVEAEDEVAAICRAASRTGVAITFRAAGTSLSGQGVTDSVLVKMGPNGWRQFQADEGGARVRIGPALIGAQANARLARYRRKIGPDPASISAAMIGGIIANNSSGMCCGTEQNSYRTLRSMRLVMADGTTLDTADPESRRAFQASHGALLDELAALARAARDDAELGALIQRKFAIKNTTGYSLNALVDYDDPFEILQHLIVGSEGTLAFICEVTLETVPAPPKQSAALVFFADIRIACSAATALKAQPVSAVEMMDYASLRSALGQPGVPDNFAQMPQGTAALLVDLRAGDAASLDAQMQAVTAAIAPFAPLEPVRFSQDPRTYADYWNVRKGLLPAVGGMRAPGSTVIVEDIAVPIDSLAEAALAIREIFDRLDYQDAVIFGHALDGNLHFVFSQAFNSPPDIARYAQLIDEVAELVTNRFHGSLKAEHGTGRAMAPFVELEWGSTAYGLMRRIKRAFDPAGVLNPGVILSDDPEIYLKAMKSLPLADPLIDKCIECGFCEPVCPSRALTTTPRQRIVATRALARGAHDPSFDKSYDYAAVDTCAGDGLCAMSCPVGIDTGEMMRSRRAIRHGAAGRGLAHAAERHLGTVMKAAKAGLWASDRAHGVLGTGAMGKVTQGLRRASGGRVPQWTPWLPKPAPPCRDRRGGSPDADLPQVLLFRSCASTVAAPARGMPDQRPLWDVLALLLGRAGYPVRVAPAGEGQCCGQPFASKGYPQAAQESAQRLESHLRNLGGGIVVSDTSPCSFRMQQVLAPDMRPMDVTEALATLVLPRLAIRRRAESIALHITCSTRKMGQADRLLALAQACADEVIVPADIECCGFAGNKGFEVPELNASALRTLRDKLPERVTRGYSTSITCEIGLSQHSGRPYQSIAYLLDWCSDPAL
ncbi:FAD-binding and (Fe-S)-binding domain-containing protein [Paracoccus thiocyanatus]|uniref:D-lactate dehydrogenase (cytochrome) n=1 Tax=Paracoccus thiocyanatus TaxID=34006 RepID=A0A3D8PA02_9RHOB|nr:FAD-binding and (Fe-S)-binding domain-containing protein [Paracoccus thiocyanatus]RDW12884.1 FAD-binding oxidoreductase [Paracoccus thiocyanatus]